LLLSVMGSKYIAYLPRYVRLEDGRRYGIPLSMIMRGLRDSVFVVRIPSDEVDDAAIGLIRRGFKQTSLALNKGELYSLTKRVYEPWELHVRIFNNGYVESEIEVDRDYLQHLTGPRFNVIYEAYEALKGFTSYRRICIKPLGECINDVIENVGIELRAPRVLIPWKPLVAAASSMLLIPILSKAQLPNILGNGFAGQ